MKTNIQRGLITVLISKKEIRNCDIQRLQLIAEGCRNFPKLAAAAQGSVVLGLPTYFKGRREQETFEHPEIAKFARAVIHHLPGFSFFIDFERDLAYKNLLLSSLSVLTLIRQNAETMLRFPEQEWDRLVEEEVALARQRAREFRLSASAQNEMCSRIRKALQQDRF